MSEPRTPPTDPSALDAITLDDLRTRGAMKWSLPDGAIGAFVAEADFGTAPAVIEAIHAAADEGLLAYLPPHKLAALREATAQKQAGYGWEVQPAWVQGLPSVLAGYRAALDHLLPADGAIIIPTPAYMPFLSLARLHGREVIEVPMRWEGERHVNDLDGIARAFDAGGQVLVLCSPHNPTGRVFDRRELEQIAQVVEAAGGTVLADEIWAPLTLDGRRYLPYASLSDATAQHTITLTAASKAFNIPGLMCAQMILSSAAHRQQWEALAPELKEQPSALGIAGTIAAYRDGQEWIDGIARYLERGRDLTIETIEQRLPLARITHAEGTYVAWIDLSAYDLPGGPAQFLREKAGVACTDGLACGETGAGCIRLITAMPHPVLREALERIVAAVQGR